MYKVEIFQNNDLFIKDLVNFIFEKSPTLKRDTFISNILNDTTPITSDIDYLRSLGILELQNVYGSTYQSSFRKNDNIYAISHTIESIEFSEGSVYGWVKPSEYGDIIDFDKGILRPVYFSSKDYELKIATFDIDFNKIKNVA